MPTSPRLLLLGALAVLVLGPATLEAQRPGAPEPGMTRQQMESRILHQFETRMANELELTADQRTRFGQVLEEFRRERGEQMARRLRLQAQVRRELQAVTGGGMELIRELQRLREDDAALQRREDEALLAFLSPHQVLRLHLAREQFAQRIRSLEQRDWPPGARRGPGGGDWRR